MSTLSAVPTLRSGDRLTRDEFLRRWEALPEIKRAELIDGVVYMPSPLSLPHGRSQTLLTVWLGSYAIATPGCEGGGQTTWLMLQSAPQPDIHLWILPEYGGQGRVEGLYAAGAPELALEVCQTSAAYDLGPKLVLYQRAGVREYITGLLQERQIIWRELAGNRYQNLTPGSDGILRSRVFPGLWLDAAAALAHDGQRVMAVLQQGLATPEHEKFVQQLARQRSSNL